MGGAGHATLLREALVPLGVEVLGVVEADGELLWRERHLGLVPVAEHPANVRQALGRVAACIERSCDLEALMAVARSAPGRPTAPPPVARPAGRVRMALASGRAFSFTYPENLALLAQAGAELVSFDPLEDACLPEHCDALYAGGGFPEVFAAALADNRALLDHVRSEVARGMVTWAECGGLLWLCRCLDGTPMVGAIPAEGRMTEDLTIGYRAAVTRTASPLGPPGLHLRGHEFHRSVLEPAGDALDLESRFGTGRAGFASPTLFAGYLHQHLAATPEVAERFVAAADPDGPDG